MKKIKKDDFIIVALSGGPDSMLLVHELKLKHKNIVVCHVNYNFRSESTSEAKFVEEYCKKNNITFELLNVDQNVKDQYKKINKNKQAFARIIRYDFFQKIAKKYNTNFVFIAHHKDDYLETAIMQEKRSNKYLFYGISEINNYQDLILIRPFIKKYWKEEIIQKLKKLNLDYKIDNSNFSDLYLRNSIRKELFLLDINEKGKILKYYISLNKANEIKKRKIDKLFLKWQNSNFDLAILNNLNDLMKEHLIFNFLSNEFIDNDIMINHNKILGIIEFLNINKNNTNNKGYRIKEDIYLKVNNNKLTVSK